MFKAICIDKHVTDILFMFIYRNTTESNHLYSVEYIYYNIILYVNVINKNA